MAEERKKNYNKQKSLDKKVVVISAAVVAVLVMIAVLAFVKSSSKPKEKIGAFDYASFDTYVNASEDYRDKYIYICGTVEDTDCYYYNDVPYSIMYVKESGDKTWICLIGQSGLYSPTVFDNHIGEKVNCYGLFKESVDGKPVMELNSGDKCVEFKGGAVIRDADMVATKEEAVEWCDSNASYVTWSSVTGNKGVQGTYISMGYIDSIKISEDNVWFDFIQKDNDKYVISNVNSWVFFNKSAYDYITGCSDSQAVSLYYIVNSYGAAYVFGIREANPSYSYDEAKDATTMQYENMMDYEWSKDGKVAFSVSRDYLDKRCINISVCVNNYEDACIAYTFYSAILKDVNFDYSISVMNKDTGAFAMKVSIDKEVSYMGTEDGKDDVITTEPSWLEGTVNIEEKEEEISALEDMYMEFISSKKTHASIGGE